MASTKELLDNKTPADYVTKMIGDAFGGLTDSDSQINEVYNQRIKQYSSSRFIQ